MHCIICRVSAADLMSPSTGSSFSSSMLSAPKLVVAVDIVTTRCQIGQPATAAGLSIRVGILIEVEASAAPPLRWLLRNMPGLVSREVRDAGNCAREWRSVEIDSRSVIVILI